jgi:hypothetical protein
MAKSLRMDPATTAEVLAQSTPSGKVAALRNALGAVTQTVSIKDGSAVEKLSGTFAGTAYTTVGSNFLPQTTLASVAGAGGTAGTGWTCRVTSANGRWMEGSFGAGQAFAAGAALSATGTTALRISIGSELPPATPPGPVADWILQSTDAPIVVPSTFLGIHSDYVAGATYPANPNLGSVTQAARALDHDPNRGWTTRLSWAAIETSPGVYNWTYLDAWVAEHSGKLLIFPIERTPSFYAQYTTAYNLYPSFPNSSSPPSDKTKISAFVGAILARHPTQNWAFEIANEPNFNFSGTGTSGESNRWSDAWAEANRPVDRRAGFYIGTPEDLANSYKTLRVWLDANGYSTVPLIGPGWEGQSTDSAVNSFRRFSNAPCTGGGVGRDYVSAVGFHSYTYDGDGRKLLAEARAYKALAATLGYGARKLWLTEIGHESPTRAVTLSDTAHADNVIRWGLIAAAVGCEVFVPYNLDSAAPSGGAAEALFLKYYSAPDTAAKIASNSATLAALAESGYPAGRTLTQAARLTDGRIWAAFADGSSKVR